jgi:hypothetical protein
MGVGAKIAVRAARLGCWFDASRLLVRVDEQRVEGSLLDRIARHRPGDPGEGGDASTTSRRWRVQWGVAAALIISISVVVTVATHASNRSQQHQRQIAAAKYGRVKIGMSPAQVRQLFGGRPEEIGTAKAPGFFEECWTYDQTDGPYTQVCFQHGRVTRKLRLGS